MILEFKVKNFRSIRDEQIFSMISEKKINELKENTFKADDKTDVLKTSIIYGRNGSGKSNLLLAIKALIFLVSESSGFKVGQSIPPFEPFRLDKKSKISPIELSLDFITEKGVRYIYSISFSKEKILDEKLYFYPKSQPAKLFDRENGKITYGEYFTGKKKQIEDLLLDNQLYLSKAGQSNLKSLHEPYLFITEMIYPSTIHDTGYDNVLINIFTNKIGDEEIPNFKENMNKLLKVADTGILSLDTKEVNLSEKDLPDDMSDNQKKKIVEDFKYQIKTKHKLFDDGMESGEEEFDLHDESTGTIKLLAVGGLILEALEDGQTLIIDELDKSLHPKLTELIIKIFHNKKTNPKNAQLIIATHDISLLDNSVFRRDQVWIAEKEYEGNSVFYSLSDIKGVRKDAPLEKWYMSGRFRGIPLINELELDLNIN
jgi:AAA15 family ATPase/GTPase